MTSDLCVRFSPPHPTGYQDSLLADPQADGTPDTAFASAGVVLTPLNTWTQATAITLLADGEVLVTGQINAYYQQAGFLAKYHVSGSPESYDNSSTQEIDYTYDVRNKLIEVSNNGSVEAAYLYNDSGDRVAETVGGVTTLYLTDTQNPTGYDKPIEQRNSATGKPIMTFILGDRVLGQVDAAGNVTYLLSDGHGSTRLLVSATGAVTAAFNYDAFGTALNFNAGMAATAFLFGGDAFYDAPSGLFFHGDGTRERLGFVFIEQDFGQSGQGNPSDPISLHKYLYANGNPVSGVDPTGMWTEQDTMIALTIAAGLSAIALSGLTIYGGARHVVHHDGIIGIDAATVPVVDKQFAQLANDVYFPTGSTLSGWEPVDPASMGLGAAVFSHWSFRARLYTSGGQYALVFKGTNPKSVEDWTTNLSQGIAGQTIPSEYGEATTLARQVSTAVGSSGLTMVGHSLGGGLADAAALATNRPAVTFNAAGTNGITDWRNGAGGFSKTMINYSIRGEALTGFQNDFPLAPEVGGTNFQIRPATVDANDDPFTLHSMDVVLRALLI